MRADGCRYTVEQIGVRRGCHPRGKGGGSKFIVCEHGERTVDRKHGVGRTLSARCTQHVSGQAFARLPGDEPPSPAEKSDASRHGLHHKAGTLHGTAIGDFSCTASLHAKRERRLCRVKGDETIRSLR